MVKKLSSGPCVPHLIFVLMHIIIGYILILQAHTINFLCSCMILLVIHSVIMLLKSLFKLIHLMLMLMPDIIGYILDIHAFILITIAHTLKTTAYE